MARRAVVIRASMRGARRAGHQLRSGARQLQIFFLEDFRRQIAPGVQRVYRQAAPRSRLMRIKPDAPRREPRAHRSGTLQRGLEARVRSYGGRIAVELVSTARSPAGYDYLGVTRYGHRVPFIQAKKGKALAIPVVGGVIFRRIVRAHKPSHDWAEAAFHEAERVLDDAQDRLGRRIDRALQ